MISNYKLIVITESTDEASKKALVATKKVLEGKSAKVTEETTWGKKVLSYSIKKQTEGIYNVMKFSLEGKEVSEVDAKLRMTNGILRYLIIKEEGKVKKETKASTSKKKKSK